MHHFNIFSYLSHCRPPGANPFYTSIDSMPEIKPRRKSIPLVSDLVSIVNPISAPYIVLLSNPVLTVIVLFMYKIVFWHISLSVIVTVFPVSAVFPVFTPSIHVSSPRGFLSNSASCFLSKEFWVKIVWTFRSLDCSFISNQVRRKL